MLLKLIKFWTRSASVLFLIILTGAFGHFFIFETTEVNGRSMEGCLCDSDIITVEKVSLLFTTPKRGQIISLFDKTSEILLVKRVIGLPGEQVEIKFGRVYIIDADGNKVELDEPYLNDGTITLPAVGKEILYPVIQENEYFILGDNREKSTDSRNYGPVHRSSIIGAVRTIGF